jgi:hypothetical protein
MAQLFQWSRAREVNDHQSNKNDGKTAVTIEIKEQNWYMRFHSWWWVPVGRCSGNARASGRYQNGITLLCEAHPLVHKALLSL